LKVLKFVLMAGLGALASACNNPGNAVQKPDNIVQLEPGNTLLIEQGQIVYTSTCASCHGVNLEGQADWKRRKPNGVLPAPPHDESGHTWHHTDQVLFDLTKYGVQKYAGADYISDMPAYEDILTDTEIIAVLSYIKSQWPENVRARHDGVNKQYEAIRKQQAGN